MELSWLVVAGKATYALVVGVVWIAVVVAALWRFREVRPSLPAGLALGAVVFLLKLPAAVASAPAFDPAATLGPDRAARIGSYPWAGIVLGIAIVGLAVGAVHLAFQVGLARRLGNRARAYPTLFRDPTRFDGWLVGAVVGGVLGVTTLLLFLWVGHVPGALPATSIARLAAALAVLGFAVAEEVLFRGLMQPWLSTRLGGGRAATAFAIAAVSALWSLGHVAGAGPLAPRLGQVFLIGLAFGWLARRYDVEASIVAHLGFNAVGAAASAWLV